MNQWKTFVVFRINSIKCLNQNDINIYTKTSDKISVGVWEKLSEYHRWKKLMFGLKIKMIRILPKNIFSGLQCDYENEIVRVDLHSSQLTKELLQMFLNYVSYVMDSITHSQLSRKERVDCAKTWIKRYCFLMCNILCFFVIFR